MELQKILNWAIIEITGDCLLCWRVVLSICVKKKKNDLIPLAVWEQFVDRKQHRVPNTGRSFDNKGTPPLFSNFAKTDTLNQIVKQMRYIAKPTTNN